MKFDSPRGDAAAPIDLESEIERVSREEQVLVLPSIDHDLVWRIGCHLRTVAQERQLGVVIEIRWAGATAFRTSMRGTVGLNDDWIRRKRNTTELFERSSYRVGLELQRDGATLDQIAPGRAAADYATLGGSFPVRVLGAGCVGSITVSGAPHREDHDLVAAALAVFC